MSKRQKTLFEAWNRGAQTKNDSFENNVFYQNIGATEENKIDDKDLFHKSTNNDVLQPTKSDKNAHLDNYGFDFDAGKTWIYPTNYPVRDYQFSIVKEALFKNTLVILPTGLGKTFIAAVVMYNIYRWYPNGKVIFMAPTRPLVAQQVSACFNVTGIPQEDTTQMTGTNLPEDRKRMWQRKRVFFLTPQVLVNDLVRNICAAASIKCLVVDEAHKALGNHAYCQVIRELCTYTSQFRVLALTATPGSDTQAVKQVLSNLLISHVEMRTEDSDDVKEYTHSRDMEKIVVPLGDKLGSLKSKFLDVINMYLKRLSQKNAMSSRNPSSLSKYQVLKLREIFSQHPPSNIDKLSYGLVMADFSLCISLYHAYELLLLHGAKSFYNFLVGIINGDKSIPHSRAELLRNPEFEEIMNEVEQNYIPQTGNQIKQGKERKVLPSHPKLEKLLEVVLEHFKKAARDTVFDTRVMIFSQYRDSVQEISEMLNCYQPMVKVMSFIGQAAKSATNVGFSQKQQLKVIQQFRSGGYNTLVSTCVGEEGLDIGEVDLIVCYDCPKSPIRLVQRMGRTGRLRKGRIIILVTEGKEEQMYNSCEYKKKSVHRAITKGFSFAQFYQNSPSLVPFGIKPVCVKTEVTIASKKTAQNVKGKNQGPFLNDDELSEFNRGFRVATCNEPLLPSSEFVSFKPVPKMSEDVCTSSLESSIYSKSKLCLYKWPLWQTSFQRIYAVSHSLQTSVLIGISKLISFPDLSRPDISFNNSKTGNESDKVPSILDDDFFLTTDDFILEDFNKSCVKQEGNKPENSETDIICSNKVVFSHSNLSKEFFHKDIDEKHNLFRKLFGVICTKPALFQLPHEIDLKSPPLKKDINNIEDCFTTFNQENFLPSEYKSNCMLRILNNKMKARLKRKSKELGYNLTFNASKNFNSSVKQSGNPTFKPPECLSPLSGVSVNNSKLISFNVAFDSSKDKLNSNISKEMKKNQSETLSFDLNFDNPEVSTCSNHCNINNTDPLLKFSFDLSSESSPYNPNLEKPSPDNELGSTILEQLFVSKTSMAEELNASFAVPLRVKKVTFENSLSKKQQKQFSMHLNNITLEKVKKAPHQTFNDSKPPSSGQSQKNISSDSFSRNKFILNNSVIETSLNRSEKNNNEASQYTLTQLLNLIDSTESTQKFVKNVDSSKTAINQNSDPTASDNTSDGEVCPTPPRKTKYVSKFNYRSSSFEEKSFQKISKPRYYSQVPSNNLANKSSLSDITSFQHDMADAIIKNNRSKNASRNIFGASNSNLVSSPQGISKGNRKISSTLNDLCSDEVRENNLPINALCNSGVVNKNQSSQISCFENISGEKSCFKHTQNESNIEVNEVSSQKLLFDISFDFPSSQNYLLSDSNKQSPSKSVKISYNVPNDVCNNIQKSNADSFYHKVSVETDAIKTKESKGNSSEKCGVNKNFELNNRNNVFKLPDSENIFVLNKCKNKNQNSPAKHHDTSITCSPKKNADIKTPSFQLSKKQKISNIDLLNGGNNGFKLAKSENIYTFNKSNSKEHLALAKHHETNKTSASKINFNVETPLWQLSNKEMIDNTDISDNENKSFRLPDSEHKLTLNKSNNKDHISPRKHHDSDETLLSPKLNNSVTTPLCQLSKRQKHQVQNDNVVNKDFSQKAPFDESDDDFASVKSGKLKRRKTRSYVSKAKKRKVSRKNDFLLSQANVSGSESSEIDLTSDTDDILEESFIDDESPGNHNRTDEHALYLQSIKNCAGLPQKYKLKYSTRQTDILSQHLEPNDSRYVYDSFCVADDEIAFISSDDEVKRNKKNKSKNKKKLKRVIICDSTSSEDKTPPKLIKNCKMNEKYVTRISSPVNHGNGFKAIKKRKPDLILISSESEDENQSPVNSTVLNDIKDKGGLKKQSKDLKNENINETKAFQASKNIILKNNFEEYLISDDENDASLIAPSVGNKNKKCYLEAKKCAGETTSRNIQVNCLSHPFDNQNKTHHDTSYQDNNKNVTINLKQSDEEAFMADVSFDIAWDQDIYDCTEEIIRNQAASKCSEKNVRNQDASDCTVTNESNQAASNYTEKKLLDQPICNFTEKNVQDHDIFNCTKQLQNKLCSSSSVSTTPTHNTYCQIISNSVTILVDSRELAGGKPVISTLRNKYGVNPVIMPMLISDYIVSNRMAVNRILDSEFGNCLLPPKVIEKIKTVNEMYDQTVVIIEKDDRKQIMSFNKTNTKYLQFLILANQHPSMQVLCSKSVDNTCELIFALIERERKRRMHIEVPVNLNIEQKKLYNFYSSLPHANPVCALNFVYYFPVVSMLFNSSAEDLKKAGLLSNRKALALLNFLKSEMTFHSKS